LSETLTQFAVDQRYDDYTSVDHASGDSSCARTCFSEGIRAQSLFKGLLNTGISFERIPRIEEMNDILGEDRMGRGGSGRFHSAGRRSWNFKPTGAGDRVRHAPKSITSNTRQRRTLCTRPPVHAPIIVDPRILELFATLREVGAKAMSSKKDFELYQAIRHLSILKERPNADPKEVDEATSWSSIARKSRRALRNGAALALALVDGRIRAYRHA